MAAVTSYVLLDFADEIIAQQPDAVIVYTGHNEYLGIGGVGSSLASAKSPTLARAIAKLRRLHLYRALERGLGSLGRRPGPARRARRHADVARGRRALHPARFADVPARRARSSAATSTACSAKYRAAGIPVFIGTLASNERDQPPFASGADPADSARGTSRRPARWTRKARPPKPALEYLAAKDRDELRFRAPEAFNEVIREVAAARGATLVDVQGALAAASRDGIIGADLMLEHVHPNVEGYFRLASAYCPAMVQWLGRARGRGGRRDGAARNARDRSRPTARRVPRGDAA